MKFNILAMLALISSCTVFTYFMISAGVPDAFILVFSFLYGLLFPWKTVTLAESKPEGKDDTDETSK